MIGPVSLLKRWGLTLAIVLLGSTALESAPADNLYQGIVVRDLNKKNHPFLLCQDARKATELLGTTPVIGASMARLAVARSTWSKIRKAGNWVKIHGHTDAAGVLAVTALECEESPIEFPPVQPACLGFVQLMVDPFQNDKVRKEDPKAAERGEACLYLWVNGWLDGPMIAARDAYKKTHGNFPAARAAFLAAFETGTTTRGGVYTCVSLLDKYIRPFSMIVQNALFFAVQM